MMLVRQRSLRDFMAFAEHEAYLAALADSRLLLLEEVHEGTIV
jgi:hypothetical protein